MDILDIAFSNDQVYMLRDFRLTVEECQNQISKISYETFYDHYRNFCDEKHVENTNLPYAVFPFYAFVFKHNAIPHPSEFLDEYFILYDESFDVIDKEKIKYNGLVLDKRAVIARVLRAYPSIIRDFHFYIMLSNEKCFDRVKYSCVSDIEGIDLIVAHDNRKYHLALYLGTRRAKAFKIIKNFFRHKKVREIEMPLAIDKAYRCGDIYLYTKDNMEIIKQKILK